VVVDFGGGSVKFHLTTVEQAKSDIQLLRSHKQEFVLKRRAIDNELAELRAGYQSLVGMMGSTYRRPIPRELQEKTGCLFFKWPVKTHYTKEDERRMHAERVAPLEDQKAQIKDAILAIDQAIVRLQRFIADSPKPASLPRARVSGRKAAKNFCTACGANRSGDELFCAECGSKFAD
jgi:hypothetical protein